MMTAACSCAFLLALIFGAMAWVQRKEIARWVRDVMVGAEVEMP